jgi:hypothetical protein
MSIATAFVILLALIGFLIFLGIVEDADEQRQAHETMRDDSD